ncbi:SprT family zinc-dependent metalloprotease [Halostella sp. JP-L12]|uniref:SprT family zinc-dependent metalloprotease n=1 Tax=Halostella TaxID=1843185 RepID=UPI000EF84EA4|nr:MULTISPECIES: SprT-like domain-containing protein [Halostella]NHN46649.1 SprT family zinc-dependent metalloprotease [Halostella sp. JP-L12]
MAEEPPARGDGAGPTADEGTATTGSDDAATTAADAVTAGDDPAGTPSSAATPSTRDELLERAAAYAETVPLDVDLDRVSWEISERAKRRAGVCRFDAESGSVTVRLTWAAYEAYGWPEFTDVIRHELVHAWEFQRFGESAHGERFREKAAAVDASRHCRSFADPRLVLRCTDPDCDWTADRHRASKTVTEPGARRCGSCGARYVVEHVETGERWKTNEGYESARARIGTEW